MVHVKVPLCKVLNPELPKILRYREKKAVLLLGEWLGSNLSTVEKFYAIPVLLSFQTKSNTKRYKFQNSQWVWFLDDNVSCRQNSMLLIWWQIYLEVMVLLWMPAFLKLWSGCLFLSQQRGTSPCSLYATGKYTHTHTAVADCVQLFNFSCFRYFWNVH